MKSYSVAVVGALGAVGQEMLKTLEQRNFPVNEIKPLDIAEYAGKQITYAGKAVLIQEAKRGAFVGVDIALFSAGATASEVLAPIAAAEGCIVIDNSSFWRMNNDVPLVIPEVNPEALREHKRIIANPNCSTIQMLVALKPLHDAFKIKRIVVSTYQAVSGSGQKGIDELSGQVYQHIEGKPITASLYSHQILFNAVPHIDTFLENGYTKEELKMVNETHKILDPSIRVSPTAVRLPVFRGHSEAINIETEKPIDVPAAVEVLKNAKGVALLNDWQHNDFPTALYVAEKDAVFVGRLRVDSSVEYGLNLWVVADNLRKGAALNAVQIAETLLSMRLI